MYDYNAKPKLHDLMEAAGPEKSQERPSLGKDHSFDESLLVSSREMSLAMMMVIVMNQLSDHRKKSYMNV